MSSLLLVVIVSAGLFAADAGKGEEGVAEKRQSGNLLKFLASEIEHFGGKPTKLSDDEIKAEWIGRRDATGAAIDAFGFKFETLTNALNEVYGAPKFYSKARRGHGPTYLYSWTKVQGVSIGVSETKTGAEITLVDKSIIQ